MISTSFDTGRIDKNDTKELVVTATDRNGNASALSALDLVLTKPDGSTKTATIGDFDQTGADHTYEVDFDQDGNWDVDITADDGRRKERETDTVYVFP